MVCSSFFKHNIGKKTLSQKKYIEIKAFGGLLARPKKIPKLSV